MRALLKSLLFCLIAGALALSTAPQAGSQTPSPRNSSLDAQQALHLADTGRCRQAMPLLLRLTRHPLGAALERRLGFDGLKCARALGNERDTVEFVLFLKQRFPRDPQVLYLATHAYSDLATETSNQLIAAAPDSVPAQELDAESLEVQGNWSAAEEVYRKILAAHPGTPGIHFRLGRDILSEPKTPSTAQRAAKEFEAELKIDPGNADAEYVLGELARENNDWPEAIKHFSQATKLDAGFYEAFLGLGMALNSAKRYTEALSPLEDYVKARPQNPTGHYQLALCYDRLGRKAQASRQIALFQKTSQALKTDQNVAQPPGKQTPQ